MSNFANKKLFGLVAGKGFYYREKKRHRNQINLETTSDSLLPLIDAIIIIIILFL